MKLRMQAMRVDRDIKQKELAEYLGCDQSLYSKYERGERDVPLRILVKLAAYYHTSIDYLVGLTDRVERYPPGSRK